MLWNVILSDEYEMWFLELAMKNQQSIATDLEVLSIMGPQLGRPYVDHVKGSRFHNMKELRTKSGKKGKTFYRRLIARADSILEHHLQKQSKDVQGTDNKK